MFVKTMSVTPPATTPITRFLRTFRRSSFRYEALVLAQDHHVARNDECDRETEQTIAERGREASPLGHEFPDAVAQPEGRDENRERYPRRSEIHYAATLGRANVGVHAAQYAERNAGDRADHKTGYYLKRRRGVLQRGAVDREPR